MKYNKSCISSNRKVRVVQTKLLALVNTTLRIDNVNASTYRIAHASGFCFFV